MHSLLKKISFPMFCIFSLIVFSSFSSSVSLIDSKICKDVSSDGDIDDPDFMFTAKISCVEESSSFTTDNHYVFFVANLDVKKDDNLTLEIVDPDNKVFRTGSDEKILSDASDVYMFNRFDISGKPLGVYTAKFFNDDSLLVSKQFSLSAPDFSCEANGFFCCPQGSKCLDPASDYTCDSGSCCISPLSCTPIVSGELTSRTVTDCVAEGLTECDQVVGVVSDYSIHGPLVPPQNIELFFRDIDVDCFNKTNVEIAVYDNSSKGVWKKYPSSVTRLLDSYKITSEINQLGYVAIVKSSKCVPLDCFQPGFLTSPFEGFVFAGSPIELAVCQITKFCDPSADGVCNARCTQGLDPDCAECSSSSNDCCAPEKDSVCDSDCALVTDPDCADDSYFGGLCYPSSPQKRGFSTCDPHCTGSDTSCSQVCNPVQDGVCSPNCPRLSNGVGYLDVDCCVQNGVSITNLGGDCCNAADDGIWDTDCLPGLDPDSNKPFTCVPDGVKMSYELCEGNNLGGYTDCASYFGGEYEGKLACGDKCNFVGCYKIDYNSVYGAANPP